MHWSRYCGAHPSPTSPNKWFEMAATWVAIAASLVMALGAACIFIFAVKRDYFQDIEDAKYQVFWSDLEELVDKPKEKTHAGSSKGSARNERD